MAQSQIVGLMPSNQTTLDLYDNVGDSGTDTRATLADLPMNVLASHALDAYATGAGNIYVSLSWLTDMESEDELVALLSHEFAHIYLHYHQLESAVADADTVTSVLGLGVALTLKTGEAARWNKVDTLLTTYTLGRGLVTTIYSQSEESAADRFSLSLTHKL
ncbi:MAG: M48 family metalloprotease, partial [Hydrogenophaga sp.]